MAYKFKPTKAMGKRFKVTGTGKVKHRHTLSTHLRSARSSKKKRHMGRPAIMSEGHALRVRAAMGLSGLKPRKVAHERALAEKAAATTESK